MAMVKHHRFAKTVEPELRCVIAGAAAERIPARKAGDIHDEAAAALSKTRQCLARAVERSVQIEIDIPSPIVKCHITHLAEYPCAGIVHKNIDSAERIIDFPEESLYLFRLSHVRGMRGDLPGTGKRTQRSIRRFTSAAAEGHRDSFVEQAFHNGTSDPTRAAGYYGDLARE